MVHDSMRNLQFDRRLTQRRDWVSEKELAAEIEALPDVADKAEVVVDEEEAAKEAPAETPAPATDFS